MAWCIGQTLTPRLHPMITTAQTLAPNDITSARGQGLYPGYFGFICVQWEEVETYRPYLYTAYDHH